MLFYLCFTVAAKKLAAVASACGSICGNSRQATSRQIESFPTSWTSLRVILQTLVAE